MAGLTPYTGWVSLGFTRGASLDDPERVLEGTGKSVRDLELRSSEELTVRRDAIRHLRRAAAGME